MIGNVFSAFVDEMSKIAGEGAQIAEGVGQAGRALYGLSKRHKHALALLGVGAVGGHLATRAHDRAKAMYQIYGQMGGGR